MIMLLIVAFIPIICWFCRRNDAIVDERTIYEWTNYGPNIDLNNYMTFNNSNKFNNYYDYAYSDDNEKVTHNYAYSYDNEKITHINVPDIELVDTKLDDNMSCCICLNRKVNTIFVDCGHLCICDKCAQELKNCIDGLRVCPICRTLSKTKLVYYN